MSASGPSCWQHCQWDWKPVLPLPQNTVRKGYPMVVRIIESPSFEANPSQTQIASLIKRNQQWSGLLRQKGIKILYSAKDQTNLDETYRGPSRRHSMITLFILNQILLFRSFLPEMECRRSWDGVVQISQYVEHDCNTEYVGI